MLASVSFYAPHALSQTLYAVGSRSMELLAEHTRFTAGLSLLSGLATVAGLTVLAEPVLSLFGPQYAEAAPIVPVLAAVAIPILVKDHFTVVYRIRHREHAALALCGGGALLELGAASFGLAAAGLAGLAWAWLLAVAGESLVMGPPLLRALGSGPGGEAPELATSGTS
jgi:O-antigen/teichoic acid export membrane protein